MGLAGVVPEVYAYRVLIGECAKKGFTQKAFNLYRRVSNKKMPLALGSNTFKNYTAVANILNIIYFIGEQNKIVF